MSITKKKILDMSTKLSGVGFMSMPYMSPIFLQEHSDTNIAATNNIMKINVPGYLMVHDKTFAKDYDWAILASNNPTSLTDKTSVQSNTNYVVFLHTHFGEGKNYGGSAFVPINPGTNTYIRLLLQSETNSHSEFFFFPCIGVVKAGIPSGSWATLSGAGTQSLGSTPYITLGNYASVCWNKIFGGDWKANFPNIDFSKI